MNQIERAIAEGYAAYKKKDFVTARAKLSDVSHPQAIHLLGLVEKGAGKYQLASSLLSQAAALDPSNPEIPNNQGLLARMAGELHIAETAFRRALHLKPNFFSARLSLGRTLSGLGKHKDAMEELELLLAKQPDNVTALVAYANVALKIKRVDAASEHISAALRISPHNASARHSYGVLALSTGQIDKAESVFAGLLAEGQRSSEINYMMARVKLEQRDVAQAKGYAETAFEIEATEANLLLLADIYWMSGDTVAFDELTQAACKIPMLVFSAIELIRQAGREHDALDLLNSLQDISSEKKHSAIQSLRSAMLLDTGDAPGALSAVRSAHFNHLAEEPDHNFVRALLANGEATEALTLIRRARDNHPESQFWLAYEATTLRLLEDERYNALVNYEKHLRTYEIPVPDGFKTLSDFNQDFLSVLEEMHIFETHPLRQSLRGGGQTPQDLTVSEHPIVRAYFKALDTPIRDYLSHLGGAVDHPTSARNTGDYKYSIGWSVRLMGGGHHVNHIHPRGWISSAYYVSLPEQKVEDGSRAGWIKFGEPPMKTVPVLSPEKWIQPKPGMLVLFPSFLWHGTEPLESGAVRVTAPFDIVPA